MALASSSRLFQKEAMKKRLKRIPEAKVEGNVFLEACGGDAELAEFFALWLTNGRDAKRAYQKMRPNVTPESACVGGSRLLSRVNRTLIAESYGVGVDRYFKQLKEGMNAKKKISINFETFDVDDHKTRRAYHEAAGRILGIERDRDSVGVQVNVQNVLEGLANE